ncbi:unnamed protein product [Clonostachys byssicola]|uniref:BZIP domain-containing protein n=1 Tax=Clonostachys byssicola TaxID=160290 RepID=A0A9N9U9R9_9HYPO|nr:unnamed protein product [Clonostachys byssicola]
MGPPPRTPKPRGARRKATTDAADPDEITAMTRRQKNREAQNAFRRRKQVAEQAQQHRLRRLEQVIEEMSCVFMGVFDQMLQTESIVVQHPGLVANLRESITKVLQLAKEVVDIDQDSIMTGNPLKAIDEGDSASAAEEPAPPEESTSAVSLPTTLTHTESSLITFSNHTPPTLLDSDMSSEEHTPGFLFSIQSASDSFSPPTSTYSSSSPSLPPQIFGNGWDTSTTPPLHIQDPFRLPSLETQNLLQALGGFPLRLIETTLSYGYFILKHSPQDEVNRGFKNTFRYRTKEQHMAGFRWLLGPGRPYMYRASGVNWGTRDGKEAAFPYHLMNPPSSSPELLPTWEESGNESFPPDYLTVLGVTDLLHNLGARILDSDTLEVRIESSQVNPNIYNVNLAPAPIYPVTPESLSFIDFFAARTYQREPLVLRLSIPLLTLNLARVSVCFIKGPGFPRVELRKVLEASVTGATGG